MDITTPLRRLALRQADSAAHLDSKCSAYAAEKRQVAGHQ